MKPARCTMLREAEAGELHQLRISVRSTRAVTGQSTNKELVVTCQVT